MIEPLESRIAPAAAYVNATTATYKDVDGDLVTVKFTKPILTMGNVGTIFQMDGQGSLGGERLESLNLTSVATAAKGTGITLTAKPQQADADPALEGDGLAHVGSIVASGIDLGAVSLRGDLGALTAGDATLTTPGVAKLTVHSLGRFSGGGTMVTVTGQLGSLTTTSDALISINADGIGAVTIGGGFGVANLNSSADLGLVKIAGDSSGSVLAGGRLSGVTIGGSLFGTPFTGTIFSNGDMGAVKIGRDVIGSGTALPQIDISTGRITSGGKLASVTIGGSLQGSFVKGSGSIEAAGDLGPVKIGRDLIGGSALDTGMISSSNARIGAITIGGDVHGGRIQGSIANGTDGAIGSIKIGGDLVGADIAGGSRGSINARKVGSITIGGSVLGGAATNAADITVIQSSGPVRIGGDVRGTVGDTAEIFLGGTTVSLTIGGSLLGGTGNNSATVLIGTGSIVIAGDVRGGNLAAGAADLERSGVVTGARIKSLTIGGSLLAGTDSSSAGDLHINAAIIGQTVIDALTIGGSIVGTSTVSGETRPTIAASGAVGSASATLINDVAIGRITVGGRVERADILAGHIVYSSDGMGGDLAFALVNSDAQIGSVTVGADWISSNLIAGVEQGTDGFGNGNDSKTPRLNLGIAKDNSDAFGAISKIASVIIKGHAIGTLDPNDTAVFGIEAQQIGSVTIAGTKMPLTAGKDLFNNRLPLGQTLRSSSAPDFAAFEVA